MIAVVLKDRVDIYDTVSNSVTAQAPYSGDDINSLEFSPDGTRLAIGTGDGEIHFWDVESKSDILVWSTHTGHSINGIRFLGQGRLVAAHSVRGRFIRIWSLERQENIITLPLPATMSAGMKFPTEVVYPLWQREPFKFDTSVKGDIMAMVEMASETLRERRTVYFWDRRPETPSQTTPRVRPALLTRDGRGTWVP
jgi:WD40 repeat protein